MMESYRTKAADKPTYSRCDTCGAFLKPMRDAAGSPVFLLGRPVFFACAKCGPPASRPKPEAN